MIEHQSRIKWIEVIISRVNIDSMTQTLESEEKILLQTIENSFAQNEALNINTTVKWRN